MADPATSREQRWRHFMQNKPVCESDGSRSKWPRKRNKLLSPFVTASIVSSWLGARGRMPTTVKDLHSAASVHHLKAVNHGSNDYPSVRWPNGAKQIKRKPSPTNNTKQKVGKDGSLDGLYVRNWSCDSPSGPWSNYSCATEVFFGLFSFLFYFIFYPRKVLEVNGYVEPKKRWMNRIAYFFLFSAAAFFSFLAKTFFLWGLLHL